MPPDKLITLSKPNNFKCIWAWADHPPNLHFAIIGFDL